MFEMIVLSAVVPLVTFGLFVAYFEWRIRRPISHGEDDCYIETPPCKRGY
jgi:hypothetical protein